MSAFGDYAIAAPTVEPGIYEAVVVAADVVKDPQTGNPKVTDSGKHQVDVTFQIDDETSLKRRYSISFGKNKQSGAYAAFASFIQAATGIPNGDARQKGVTESDLLGRHVRIVTVVTDEGYTNIESVAPPPKSTQKARPLPADEEIPF